MDAHTIPCLELNVRKGVRDLDVNAFLEHCHWHRSYKPGNNHMQIMVRHVTHSTDSQNLKVQPWDPSRPKRSLRVSLHDYKQDWLLTEAFLIPYILRDDANYVNNNKRFSINVSSTGTRLSGQDVIVIRKVLDKPKIARLLIFLLIISPALGIVVGLCTHKAGVGIAVSAGVFALASFLQGFTAWFHR